MSPAHSGAPVSVEKYLELERESEERHEYLDGLVYAE